jgi:hypothetical protein
LEKRLTDVETCFLCKDFDKEDKLGFFFLTPERKLPPLGQKMKIIDIEKYPIQERTQLAFIKRVWAYISVIV